MVRLTWVAVLALGGCTTGISSPPPSHAPPTAGTLTAAKTDPETSPAADTPASEALVVDGNGLLKRLGVSGVTGVITSVTGADSCSVDHVHNVVWLVGSGTLSAYDFESQTMVSLASAVPTSLDAWGVRYQDGDAPFPHDSAGNIDGLSHCVSLVLTVSKKPTLGGVYTGEGDREVYCGEYDDDGEELILNDDSKKELAALNKAQLSNPGFVRKLVGRRATPPRNVAPALTVPAKPSLAISRSECQEIPEDCGSLEYLGGGRIWKVTTGNSRGDFFHEDFQLYDAEERLFWDPGADVRQRDPFKEGDQMFEFEVAPDGTWAVYEDKILSLTDAKLVGTIDGGWCGWAQARPSP